MPQPPYRPPEFDPTTWQQVPIAEIGSVALQPEMSVTNVGGFVDLSTVQRGVVEAAYLDGAPNIPQARALALRFAHENDALLGKSLATLLRPRSFNGTIVNGLVHILPYDADRVAAYTPYVDSKMNAKWAATMYIAGSLGSRGEVSSPFTQEVTIFFSTGKKLRRWLGPTDALKAAAAEVAGGRSRSRLIGELTDTDVGAMRPHRTDRGTGEDGTPQALPPR
jgi:hypothetical protein